MDKTDKKETPVTVHEDDKTSDLDELEQELAVGHGPERSRKRKLILLVVLLVLLCGVSVLAYRYFDQPAPLPDLILPDAEIHYPPHYLFSIYDLEKPIGVTVSADGTRIYVSENGGERLIKVFDRDGELINSFSPPGTGPGERSPVYLAADSHNRLYVTDRMQHAIYVYDNEGNFLDMLVSPDLALSEYVNLHTGAVPVGSNFTFNVFQNRVTYSDSLSGNQILPAPSFKGWSPLGVRIDAEDRIYITDVTKDKNRVMEFNVPSTSTENGNLRDWNIANADIKVFGASGAGNAEFLFPNAAVVDSQGRRFVSDGNNGRIAVWDADGNFLFNFGGTGQSSLSLPRGIFVDDRDRLFVVDAVGQDVKVFDVSNSEPEFLYSFGEWGMEDASFNYPNDLYVDDSGRIYVVDRENNRLQVWSY
jgi:DNA-binding beta-propeller fold protein YncE